MACIPLPTLPIPTLPSPLTIPIPAPAIDFDATLCCKLFAFKAAVPPIKIAIFIDPVIMATIRAGVQAVQSYIDAIPNKCPRE